MQVSASLAEFQRHCQQYYVCYGLSSVGMRQFASNLESQGADRTKSFHMGNGHPDDGDRQGTINIGILINSCQDDGAFPDIIAKSFITAIYTSWDELYRHLIARENGVHYKAIKCDLMGDLRLIRHCIVHRKSTISDEGSRCKKLAWSLAPGPLNVSSEMFKILMDQINRVLVWVEA